MREPADLPTPAQARYAARKAAIAECRARIVDALISERACEDSGQLFFASMYGVRAMELIEDLNALLEDWIADYPPDAPTPFSQVAST